MEVVKGGHEPELMQEDDRLEVLNEGTKNDWKKITDQDLGQKELAVNSTRGETWRRTNTTTNPTLRQALSLCRYLSLY